MTGIHSFKTQRTSNYFYINRNGNLTISGSYDFLNASYINVRVVVCDDPLPFLITATQECVANCPVKFYANNND